MRILLLLGILCVACSSPPRGAGTEDPDPNEDRDWYGLWYDREYKQQPLYPELPGGPEKETETTQVRPFYWHREGPGERERTNILFGLYRYRQDEAFTRVQIFPNMFYTARHTPQDMRTWWFMFFPFVWLGHNDFLVWPIGGYSKGILGIDQLIMVGPFYMRTKHIYSKPNDPTVFTTHYILWPFIGWGSDGKPGGRRRFRVAPIYGRTDLAGGGESGFFMWPFYTWQRKGEYRGWFSFPFAGVTKSPTRKTVTVMWPIYSRNVNYLTGATDTAFWPVYRRAKGGDEVDINRFWPFREYRRTKFDTYEYWAWPVMRRRYVSDKRMFAKHTYLAPFYRRFRYFYREDGTTSKKTIVWPIGRFEDTREGGREVTIPVYSPVDGPSIRELTEPIRPFISIYHKKVKANGDRDLTAGFGFLISRRKKNAKKVKLFWGFLGWERTPKGRYVRLFWALRLRVSSKP